MSNNAARITLGLAILIAVASSLSGSLYVAIPLSLIAVFLIVWGRAPVATVNWIGGLPWGEPIVKWLRYLDGIVSPARDQGGIDEVAEEVSWAIANLLNRNPLPATDSDVAQWEHDYRAWCEKVSGKLGNRALFTRADQLHFDDLGFVDDIMMSGHRRHNWLLGQLKLKIERAREVIERAQQR